MKRIISMIMALLLAFTFTGCSEETENEKPQLKAVPTGLYKEYEEADFHKFNSPAKENGLGGTKIWIEGSFSEINTLDSEGQTMLFAIIKDSHGHEWLVLLDIEQFNQKSTFEKLVNHQLLLTGIYSGYTEVYEMPMMDLIQLYDRETGNITTSETFSLIYGDSSTPAQQQNEPQKENDSNVIRPEIKESIDAYEAFIDEYVAFMEKYDEADNSTAMMMDYLNMIDKLEKLDEKMNAMEEDLTDAEEDYYLEVMTRCSAKLLKSME